MIGLDNMKKFAKTFANKKNIEDLQHNLLKHFQDMRGNYKNTIEKRVPPLFKDLRGATANPKDFASTADLFFLKNLTKDADTTVTNNNVSISFFSNIKVLKNSSCDKNIFSSSWLSSFKVTQSDFNCNKFVLFRASDLNVIESLFSSNHFSKSNIENMQIKLSDFTNAKLLNISFTNLDISYSRLNEITFSDTKITDCKFIDCDIQNLSIASCSFTGCQFKNIVLDSKESKKLVGKNVVNKVIADCKSMEDLLRALDSESQTKS